MSTLNWLVEYVAQIWDKNTKYSFTYQPCFGSFFNKSKNQKKGDIKKDG